MHPLMLDPGMIALTYLMHKTAYSVWCGAWYLASLSLLLFYYLCRINWKTYPWYTIVLYNQNWDKVDSGFQGHGRRRLSRIHCGESSHFRVSLRTWWSPPTGLIVRVVRCVKVTEPWPGQLGTRCSLACREDGKSQSPDYSPEIWGQTLPPHWGCSNTQWKWLGRQYVRQHQQLVTGSIKAIPHRAAKCPVCGVHGSWLYFSEGYNCSAFESEMENVWHIWCGEDRKMHWKEYGLRGEKLLPSSAPRQWIPLWRRQHCGSLSLNSLICEMGLQTHNMQGHCEEWRETMCCQMVPL